MRRKLVLVVTGLSLVAAFAVWFRIRSSPSTPPAARFPEQLVYARSSDDVLNAGALFTPPKDSAKPLAVIWVHGWGANFYLPPYVAIARELATAGFPTITVNTRMHGIGNVQKHDALGKRVRGGGYWGVTSQSSLDIAAWVDFAERAGFARVVLAGHSAGWASVARYQAETADPRVAGIVLASPMVGVAQPSDPALVEQAKRAVAEGAGERLLNLPNRSFPSYVSAATYLDMENTPAAFKDFFGISNLQSAGVLQVKCPILAFFGSRGDIGGDKDLTLLKTSILRLPGEKPPVETALIANGNHNYDGEHVQVAAAIARWAGSHILK